MQKTIKAKVRGLSKYYVSGLELLEIWVLKVDADEMPYVEGKRVPVNLKLEQDKYEAGLRSTRKNKFIWLCPDLKDIRGEKVSLSEVLNKSGIEKNSNVYLTIRDRNITVKR